jgi:hypothetical protein
MRVHNMDIHKGSDGETVVLYIFDRRAWAKSLVDLGARPNLPACLT